MPRRLALCIGINDLRYMSERNLAFAKADAIAIHRLLTDPRRGNFVSNLLLDSKATKSEILKHIIRVLQNPHLTKDDVVLIYFSGHGGLDEAGNLFLVAHDTTFIEKSDSFSLDFSSTVHIKEIEIGLDNTNAGTVVLLFDTCHSGASSRLLGRIRYQDRKNIVIIGSALGSETAKEDPTLGHGVFTECFKRALSKKPTYGEWITLQQALGFVKLEMERLGLTQTMEISSHIVEPNILLVKNPEYTLSSSAFTKMAKRSFELAGYQILAANNQPNFFIAQLKIGFQPSRTGVLCLCNNQTDITSNHIKEFNTWVKHMRLNGDLDNGILVTSKRISSELRAQILPSIGEWLTSDELTRKLLDFDIYIKRLIEDYELKDHERPLEPPLSRFYINLDAETRKWRGAKHWRGPVEDIVSKWLDTGDEQRLAIIGGFGSGKTSFSKKLARDLAKRYLTTKERNLCRIPILIYLRDFPRGHADLEALIINHLSRRCTIPNPSWLAFKAMNEAGLFLLIFDGFDEMAVRSHKDVIERNLNEISKLASAPRSKVILTSRPEYFFTESEEKEMLEPSSVLFHQRRFRRVTLLPFQAEQIEEFLRKRIPLLKGAKHDWQHYMNHIRKIHDLSDLCRRPVLLEMVTKTLPALIEKNRPLDRPLLYETYIEGELRRQAIDKGRFSLLKREDRFGLMQLLAREFFEKKHVGLRASQILDIMKEHLTDRQREELEGHLADFLTCSFLTREGDMYRFAHRTLMEFLTAKTLAEEINFGKPGLFDKAKLTPEVGDFLAELHPDMRILWKWVRTRSGGYIGANALVTLHKTGHSFVRKRLQRADFHETGIRVGNFVGTDLSNTSLRGADFRGAILNDANLMNSDLQGINLREASLIGTNLRHANLVRANLSHICASKADLREANLSYCDLRYATLIEVEFDDQTAVHDINFNLLESLYTGRIDATFAKYILEENSGKWTTKQKIRESRKYSTKPLFVIRCSYCNYNFDYSRWPFAPIPPRQQHRERFVTKLVNNHLAERLPSHCPSCKHETNRAKISITRHTIDCVV